MDVCGLDHSGSQPFNYSYYSTIRNCLDHPIISIDNYSADIFTEKYVYDNDSMCRNLTFSFHLLSQYL